MGKDKSSQKNWFSSVMQAELIRISLRRTIYNVNHIVLLRFRDLVLHTGSQTIMIPFDILLLKLNFGKVKLCFQWF